MTENQRFLTMFRQGTRLLHDGLAHEALPLLERAQALNPKHVDAALNLSGALILTKKFRRAKAVLEKLVEIEPSNAMVWINLGAANLGNPVLAGAAQQKKAIDAFKRALELNPLAPSAAYNIGLIYRDRQEISEAIHWFERAVQADPNDRDAEKILGQMKSE